MEETDRIRPACEKKEIFGGDTMIGVFLFPNGDKYEGEYRQIDSESIERNGHGTHMTATGLIYEGLWENDKMNGEGVLTQPNDACYIGTFVNNQFHGVGKYIWPDGSVYDGQFVENRLEGEGEFTDTDGQTWVGTFHYKAAPGLKFKLNMD